MFLDILNYENVTFVDYIDAFFIFIYVGTIAFLIYKEYRSRFFDYIFALVVAAGASELIKSIINRPRPELGMIKGFEGSGFPSTHTTIAFTAFFFYVFVCQGVSFFSYRGGKGSQKKRSGEGSLKLIPIIFLGIGAFLVGLLRISVGAHYAVDVFAGIILGFLVVTPFMYYDVSLKKIR